MTDKTIGFLLWVSIAVASMVLIGLNYYTFIENDTNHTSIELRRLATLSLVSALLSGLVALLYKRRRRVLIILAALTATLSASIYVFESQNILMEYDVWLEKGMPSRVD